ncbi:cupredoxin domain-containing protein [Streptacidiphilus cavernicola]|uniref:Cupredoxin domain-containing protein n=1 Tax=Streptacidiphilus cavernicola TaxID=3342716 RepID=A0ABV6VX98_9ACTN
MFRSRRLLPLLLGLLLLPLSACSSGGSTSNQLSTTVTSAASSAAAAVSSAATATGSGTEVVIHNFAFAPDALTVKPGQKLTVVNKDSTAHTLTATGNKAFDTGTIAPGATATFTAPSTPGSYPYICTIHQFMHGTLTVK